MHFALNEEQAALRQQARRFLQTHSPSAVVRAAMQSAGGHDAALWQRIGQELGWPALVVPEAHGGAGLGMVELCVVAEELGRALAPTPFFSTVCLAGQALRLGASEAQRAELLPKLAAGELALALAHSEADTRVGEDATAGVTLRPSDGGFVLDGEHALVIDGHGADRLIVAARHAEARRLSLVLVDPASAGVQITPRPALDATRRLARVVLHDVSVPSSAVLGRGGAGGAALQRALELGAVALAAEQLGGAERCLELSVAHAKERVQFGRPIGSFQAIKHKLADMLVLVESARSACYFAAWAAGNGEAPEPGFAEAVHLAKAYCSDAYFQVAAETLQVHGGIGFTWEHDVHLHLKRAKSSQLLLGDPPQHRERFLQAMGL